MAWIEPIFDRTEADKDYAYTHRDEAPTLKGAINAMDWARITGNVHFIAELLTFYGYSVTANCKTSWVREDRPTHNQVMTIYNDIERIQTAFLRYAHTPGLSWNHYEKINEIERILFEMRSMLTRMVAAFRHSGTFYSGQGGLRV